MITDWHLLSMCFQEWHSVINKKGPQKSIPFNTSPRQPAMEHSAPTHRCLRGSKKNPKTKEKGETRRIQSAVCFSSCGAITVYIPGGCGGDGCTRYRPENTIAGQFRTVLNGRTLYLQAVECPNLFLAGSVSPWGHCRDPLGFAW